MRLRLLIDSLPYIESNCYQHQLFKTLNRECESVTITTINEIISNQSIDIKNDETVLSCLKLRTLFNGLTHVKKFLNGRKIYIYEQDPWESFKDDSPYKGSYEKIANELNVASFLNTSKWWSDYINSRGIKSKFVKMWMLPEYCSSSPDWKDREIDIGFCGQIHPYRKRFFDYLNSQGISVTILETTSYQNFLNNLSKIKIYAHNEQVSWKVDGELLSANALWIKDIEAAARGCVSLRDHEEELKNYVQNCEISTIFTYESLEQSVDLIKKLLNDKEDFQSQVEKSVNAIKSDIGWKSVIEALHE